MPKKVKKEAATLNFPPVPAHLLVRHQKRWVTVHFKLMGFAALDSLVRLPPDATVRMLEFKIISYHCGSINKLAMWHDRVEPSCIIRDSTLTLREVYNLDDSCPRQLPFNFDLNIYGAGHSPYGSVAGSLSNTMVMATNANLNTTASGTSANLFSSFAGGNNNMNTTVRNLNMTTSSNPGRVGSPSYTPQGVTGGGFSPGNTILLSGARGAASLENTLYNMANVASNFNNATSTVAVENPDDHHVLLYYDYHPHDSDCPLLLRPPRYPASVTSPTLATTTAAVGAGGNAYLSPNSTVGNLNIGNYTTPISANFDHSVKKLI